MPMGSLSGTCSLSSEWSFLFFISRATSNILSPPFITSVLWNKCTFRTFASGLPWWSSGREFIPNAGDKGSIPGLGRFHMGRCNWSLCVLEPVLRNWVKPPGVAHTSQQKVAPACRNSRKAHAVTKTQRNQKWINRVKKKTLEQNFCFLHKRAKWDLYLTS